ncbi:cation:proton antiporter domain-containing protein [Marinimicrococcus flavescens]|uniref:Cation:proton antiporter n=1 Tax=Marinimicrococcus flavescens TaxID=3031815 RepID=A0AAP4D6K2_9PROT|nr:cation:proton antiporter [Marinimicrococcus flavescens]
MHSEDFLFAAMIGLAAGTAALVLFRRLGFGSILALLATGILVGPWGIGLGQSAQTLMQVTELGVVFLLFVIGLELEPRRLWEMRRALFGLGSLQVVVTGLALGAVFAFILDTGWRVGLIAGLGLALSSTAFVMKLLEEQGELGSQHGRHALAILLLQDMAVVPLLALVPLLGDDVQWAVPSAHDVAVPLLALGFLWVFGHLALPKAFELAARQRNSEAFAALAGLGVTAAAWAMNAAGLSPALGSFLLGILLSRSRYHHQIEAEIAPFKGWLLGLFFVAVGMSIDLGTLGRHAFLVLAEVAALILVKVAVLLLLGRLFRLDWASALRTALLLAQGGEFGFVLFGAALAAGLFSSELHAIGILVISVSMMLTPFLAHTGERLAARLVPRASSPAGPGHELERHIVIAGFGRVGDTVARMLEAAELPYLAIDLDGQRVADGIRAGRHVAYGNASDPRLLEAAGVGRAAAVVVTLDSPADAERVVSTVRTFHPQVRVVARSRDLAARDRMLRAGVSEAVPETVEMSLALGEAVLRGVGVPADLAQDIGRSFRAGDFALARDRA